MLDVDCTCTGSLLQWFLTFTCCTIVTHQLCDDDSRAFATKDMVREILSNVMRPCVCKASLNGVPFCLFSSTLLVLPHCWIPARSPAGFKAAPIHFWPHSPWAYPFWPVPSFCPPLVQHFFNQLCVFSFQFLCLCVNLRLQQSYVLLLHLWRWLHQLINWNGKDIRGVTLYAASVENGNTLKHFTFLNT